MRICLQCDAHLSGKRWHCPDCGWSPEFQDGFPLLAPYLADGFSDYPLHAHEKRVHLEATSFWFQCRNQIITNALDRFFPRVGNFLEVGCGTGFVISGISRTFPGINIFGAEAYPSALKYANERIHKAEFAQMDVMHLPFTDEFDVVGCFDVLEHLEDDIRALSEIYKAGKRGMGLIITVPQHPWLWSKVDEKAGHKRRYTRDGLKNKVQTVGFEVLSMTSFITLLLPLMVASRWRKSRQRAVGHAEIHNELNISQSLNTLFKLICALEVSWIKNEISLPVGGSLLCIAKKKVV